MKQPSEAMEADQGHLQKEKQYQQLSLVPEVAVILHTLASFLIPALPSVGTAHKYLEMSAGPSSMHIRMLLEHALLCCSGITLQCLSKSN